MWFFICHLSQHYSSSSSFYVKIIFIHIVAYVAFLRLFFPFPHLLSLFLSLSILFYNILIKRYKRKRYVARHCLIHLLKFYYLQLQRHLKERKNKSMKSTMPFVILSFCCFFYRNL